MTKKFCDANTFVKSGDPSVADSALERKVKNYNTDYLTPANVGARKGIFVPRSLVDKLLKLVRLYDVEDLTVGAYVTNILVIHLAANREAINELTRRGNKTVPV